MSVFLVSFIFAANGQQMGLSDGTTIGVSSNAQGNTGPALARERVRDGSFLGEGGKNIKISGQDESKCKLETGGIEAECGIELLSEEVAESKTKLFAKLSNGEDAEIKVMPDTASSRALQRLRIKNCNMSNGCTIELKQTGVGNQSRLSYEINVQKRAKMFGLFATKMRVGADVDAESGEIIRTRKPWWAFLASETEEEPETIETLLE